MVKKILKYLGYVLLSTVLASIIFFFWASSPRLDKNEYLSISGLEKRNIPDTDSVYSILTYNIGYLSGLTNNKPVKRPRALFQKNMNRVKEILNAVKPDILAFQEIDFNSKRSFHINQHRTLARSGFSFGAEVVNWDEHYVPYPYYPVSMHFGEILSGQSVLSKFKILNQERLVLERVEDTPFWRDAFYLDRIAQVITVLINDEELKLINVHLEAFDKPTRKKQSKQVESLYKKYASEYPTILLGDFNSDPTDDAATIKVITQIPGIRKAITDNSLKTFPSDSPEQKLDYIFYNEKYIEKIEAKVMYDFGDASDHIPVFMKFRLKN